MITEDYVSFETAKLLKEKGFDAEGVSEFGGYYVDHEHNGQNVGIATESMMLNKTLEDWEYLRPTLQMAMKWLRETIGITIGILFKGDRIYYEIHKNNEFVFGVDTPESYEKVCDEAIRHCLKILI